MAMESVPFGPRDKPRDLPLYAAAVAGAAVVFLVDLQQPLGYAVGILYVLAILLGLWIEAHGAVISDPYGYDEGVFGDCFSLIEAGINAIAEQTSRS